MTKPRKKLNAWAILAMFQNMPTSCHAGKNEFIHGERFSNAISKAPDVSNRGKVLGHFLGDNRLGIHLHGVATRRDRCDRK